jgi:uncharacterized membrane protein YeaQ/YmgE (transglycosylase-associated protein family)
MSLLVCIGVIFGFLGGKIVDAEEEGYTLNIILGILGAVVAGWLYLLFGGSDITGVTLSGGVVAVVGAVVVVIAFHAIRRSV